MIRDQIEDALNKGVALYFVQEAEIISERWYWRDKTVKKTVIPSKLPTNWHERTNIT